MTISRYYFGIQTVFTEKYEIQTFSVETKQFFKQK